MATKNINELTEVTAALADDKIAIWRAANGDTRYIKKSNYLADVYNKTNTYLVDPNFTLNTAAKRYTTIQGALSAAAAGSTIMVAPGTYTENLTFGANNVTLIGSGQPYYDGTNLIGGTIIIGLIDCDGKRGTTIKDLGVDIRTTAQVDAISSDNSAAGTTAIYQEFHNLILIGRGSDAAGHGILCQTGGGNVIRNCKFYTWTHGVALRCSNSIVSDCYFYNCLGDSVIIKSDTGSGNAWNNTITNCIIDGATTSGYTRGGPIRIQSNHASFTTRFNTVSNITAKNCGEACVLIQQVAGTCANVMVSNVISYSNGDSAGRADFDVDAATDVHFSNCMSAQRSAGYGFRSSAAGLRVRAMNCSSDLTGAGRFSGSFDYLDLGSGLGIDYAQFKNVTFDQQTSAIAMRDSCIVTGKISTVLSTAVDAITCLWTGNGNYSSLAIDLLVTLQSGTIARTYQYQIAVVRANTTTLAAAIQQVGSTLNTSGSGNSMTAAVGVATANTAKIQFTGVTGASVVTYTARIVSLTTSSWSITAA